MPIRRKNVDLLRLKRSTKRNKFFECLSLPCVQYLMIFLLWGILLVINQSTEMRFEYFWPGWLFICSTHDSLKYQGLQYTLLFVVIVLTTDLLFFFLFPPSWIYFCGSAYVWIYLLWHTDQGLCFLTLTFCLTFVYFELGFQSRDVKFNHSIYFFRPFAAHSMGYPVVCMGFSIMRYLEVRHRKNRTMNVRRQNCLYFRILRDAVPVSLLTEFSNGTCPTYLPDCEVDTQKSKRTLIQEGDDCNLSCSVFLFSQLASSCFSRFGQWCYSYPLPLDHTFINGEVVSSHALCSRSNLGVAGSGGHFPGGYSGPELASLDCAEHQLMPDGCTAARPATAGRPVRPGSAVEVVQPGFSGTPAGGHYSVSGGGGGGAPSRQPGSQPKSASHPPAPTSHPTAAQTTGQQSAGNSTASSSSTSSRCTKDNPVVRLENTVRRLRNDVQSMRAVESRLRSQLGSLESASLLSQQCLAEQRQANEATGSRVAKLTSRSRSERASLVSLEQSLAEEKRLGSAVHEQLIALEAQLSVPTVTGATAETVIAVTASRDHMSLAVGAEKAVQTNTTYDTTDSSTLPGALVETLVTPRDRTVSIPDRVALRDTETDCCQRRRLLECELRAALQRRQQQQQPRLSTDQPGSAALAGDASTRSRVRTVGKGHSPSAGLPSGLPAPITTTTTSSSGAGSSHLQGQRSLLETYIKAAGKERARLECELKDENWVKQQLLTAFHNSVGEINNLTDTLKQRDTQINELSQKVDQYKRYLSIGLAGDRARTAVSRAAGSQNPPTALWTPAGSVPQPVQAQLRVRPASVSTTDIGQPAVMLFPSSPPFSLAMNGLGRGASAGYSPEDPPYLAPRGPTASLSSDLVCEQSGQTGIVAGCGCSTSSADPWSSAGYRRFLGQSEPGSNREPADEHHSPGCVRSVEFVLPSALGGNPPATGLVFSKVGRQAVHRPANEPGSDSLAYAPGLGRESAALGPGSASRLTETESH